MTRAQALARFMDCEDAEHAATPRSIALASARHLLVLAKAKRSTASALEVAASFAIDTPST